MRGQIVIAFLLALSFSGCLAGDSGPQASKNPSPSSSDETSGSPTPTTSPPGTSPPTPTNNGTGGGGGGNGSVNQTEQAPWPNVASATIRPGTRINSDSGQCTSNFLFRSPDNATLYLGLAAHCVNGMDIGDVLEITGAAGPGILVYSSWIALNLTCELTAAGTGCTGGQHANDFALVKVSAQDRSRTHPAVRHFGGPVSLADSNDLGVGERVLTYGNSGLRAGIEPSNWHEGVVTDEQGGPQFRIYTATPGVPGDSGSGVLTKDGEAAGVLVTVAFAPIPGENGVVGLKDALELARVKTGLVVELVTWQLLDDGLP